MGAKYAFCVPAYSGSGCKIPLLKLVRNGLLFLRGGALSSADGHRRTQGNSCRGHDALLERRRDGGVGQSKMWTTFCM
jgi:hypothetical protein